MRIAFAGLGVMGAPMAGHLLAAGHEVVGYNRTLEKAQAWAAQHRARWTASAAEAADGCDALVLCVGRDEDVRQVVAAALVHLTEGALIIDHTTTSATLAREMATLTGKGGRAFIDAPVSGGQAGAQAGTLTAMCGGDGAAFERAQPIMAAYAKTVRRIGESGAGQLAKMCNQIAIAGVVQGLAEAVHFAEQAGLDADAVFQAVSAGAAGSWQMQNRWASMVEGRYDFGFAVDWMRKDLGLVLDEARTNGSRLALTALVDQFYAEVQAMGGRRWDTSSLVARLKPRP